MSNSQPSLDKMLEVISQYSEPSTLTVEAIREAYILALTLGENNGF